MVRSNDTTLQCMFVRKLKDRLDSNTLTSQSAVYAQITSDQDNQCGKWDECVSYLNKALLPKTDQPDGLAGQALYASLMLLTETICYPQ